MTWPAFLRAYHIPYYKGSSKNGGNVEIHCPFCGPDDRKHHMTLSMKTSLWSCWKNKKEHSGQYPVRLIQKLLNLSYEQAEDIQRQYFSPAIIGTAKDASLLTAKLVVRPVQIPENFYPFRNYEDPQINMIQQPFIQYLTNRGIDASYAGNRFGLRWCVTGTYGYRIIIPIMEEYGQWMTFTARSISNSSDVLRYLTCGQTDNRPDDYLFDEPNLTRGGDCLLISEGSFDAMKLNSCMIPGVVATALFGKNISTKQINKLMKIAPLYRIILLALDRDARAESVKWINDLKFYLPRIMHFEQSAKDLGSMSIEEIKRDVKARLTALRVYEALTVPQKPQEPPKDFDYI